ncbi:MAG TPA: glutathione S-transferase N-terminal domain-containing protein [Thermohalobaculum sp.]|nr:glutathione S-transferase N-terminal domain-containing protein [Thermohalobaculum sp.]
MKLIIASPSPFARKARIALHEKGLPFEEVMDVPWNPDTVAPSHNPLGKIPVLILEDGSAIYDSRVIVEYLETLGAPPALIPADPAARIAARRIEALADGICDAVVLTVLEQSRREGLRSADWIARQRHKIALGTAELARLLGGRAFFVGEALTLADIAAGAALAYLDLRAPDYGWREQFPELAAFSARMEARQSFTRTRPYAQDIAPVG